MCIFFSHLYQTHKYKNTWTAKAFKFENIISPDIRFTENSNANGSAVNTTTTNSSQINQSAISGGGGSGAAVLLNMNANNTMPATTSSSKSESIVVAMGKPPLAFSSVVNANGGVSVTPQAQKLASQTPSTLVSASVNNTLPVHPSLGLHKQLKYEESPSLGNQTCDLASFKYAFFKFYLLKKSKKTWESTSIGMRGHLITWNLSISSAVLITFWLKSHAYLIHFYFINYSQTSLYRTARDTQNPVRYLFRFIV